VVKCGNYRVGESGKYGRGDCVVFKDRLTF